MTWITFYVWGDDINEYIEQGWSVSFCRYVNISGYPKMSFIVMMEV